MKPAHKFRRLNPDTVVLIRQISVGVLTISVFVGCCVALWHAVRIDRLTLTEISVSGGETVNHALIRTAVEQQLEGTYFGFIPRRFAWTYPDEDIALAVDQIERVYGVTVERQSGRSIAVSFEEHRPEALWCNQSDSTNCLFIDRYGYAFAPAPALRGGSLVRYIHTSHNPVVGETLTDRDQFDALRELLSLLKENNWHINQVEVDAAGDAFLRVVEGGEFKVTLTAMTPGETVENLQVILTSSQFAHIEPGNFTYIDLRFGEKVFVNEELAAPEEVAASSSATSSASVPE